MLWMMHPKIKKLFCFLMNHPVGELLSDKSKVILLIKGKTADELLQLYQDLVTIYYDGANFLPGLLRFSQDTGYKEYAKTLQSKIKMLNQEIQAQSLALDTSFHQAMEQSFDLSVSSGTITPRKKGKQSLDGSTGMSLTPIPQSQAVYSHPAGLQFELSPATPLTSVQTDLNDSRFQETPLPTLYP
jgi:hypothetical protein